MMPFLENGVMTSPKRRNIISLVFTCLYISKALIIITIIIIIIIIIIMIIIIIIAIFYYHKLCLYYSKQIVIYKLKVEKIHFG